MISTLRFSYTHDEKLAALLRIMTFKKGTIPFSLDKLRVTPVDAVKFILI